MTRPDDGEAAVEESLAAERTSLAWNRTSLALLACGAAVLKGLPAEARRHPRPLIGLAIVALALAAWMASLWTERRRRAAIANGDLAAEASSIAVAAGSTAAIGVVAFLLALLL
ncbi:MAG TPA: DUF202 domain-containing protein [Acidimicrobiales bacterium]|nr:DUF202 domain-containing protein [Acidimicrobiales bacterium]